jgi:hypothetical protein
VEERQSNIGMSQTAHIKQPTALIVQRVTLIQRLKREPRFIGTQEPKINAPNANTTIRKQAFVSIQRIHLSMTNCRKPSAVLTGRREMLAINTGRMELPRVVAIQFDEVRRPYSYVNGFKALFSFNDLEFL